MVCVTGGDNQFIKVETLVFVFHSAGCIAGVAPVLGVGVGDGVVLEFVFISSYR